MYTISKLSFSVFINTNLLLKSDKPINVINLEKCKLYKNKQAEKPLINWKITFELHSGNTGKVFLLCCKVTHILILQFSIIFISISKIILIPYSSLG